MRNILVVLTFLAAVFYVLSMFYEWFHYGSLLYVIAPIIILVLISIVSFTDAFREGVPKFQQRLFLVSGSTAVILAILLIAVSL